MPIYDRSPSTAAALAAANRRLGKLSGLGDATALGSLWLAAADREARRASIPLSVRQRWQPVACGSRYLDGRGVWMVVVSGYVRVRIT
jgi:hypothetical protein